MNFSATPAAVVPPHRISTGVDGLDRILGGGLTPQRVYLLEGTPGTGKTTFALRFLLAGVARREKGLYVTLSETAVELQAVVASHGWSLDGIDVCQLVDENGRDPDAEQSILHPSEVELGETIRKIKEQVSTSAPSLVVFDSLSEMRLLAQDPLRYRRQVLALKQFFSTRACTVLLLDDKTSEPGDLQLHSICHGVISLEQVIQQFGTETRRLRVVKLRGQRFHGGQHDFMLKTGRVDVFPRLIASEHRDPSSLPSPSPGGGHGHGDAAGDADEADRLATERRHEQVSTGVRRFDQMLGGGLTRGTSTLLLGPSGIGKTTSAVSFMHAALCRGERATYYVFDESQSTLLLRSRQLGIDVQPFVDSGACEVVQIDPAELSPGEFSARVLDAVSRQGARFVVLDSLNAYLQAMPGQSFLLLHMHELLTYLNHRNVTTVLVVGQHGTVGQVTADIDLSYLSDATLMYRFFESNGAVRSAVTAMKSRTAPNERTIREFRVVTRSGVEVGEPLVAFEGVFSGLPTYRGGTRMLGAAALFTGAEAGLEMDSAAGLGEGSEASGGPASTAGA